MFAPHQAIPPLKHEPCLICLWIINAQHRVPAKRPLNRGLFKEWRFKGFSGTILEVQKQSLSRTWDDSNKGVRQRQKHQEVWKRLNLTVHSQNSERPNVFLWPKTYCKLACDSIKTNMNRVLKIWRKRNLWPFLLLLFICCKRNKKKEIKARYYYIFIYLALLLSSKLF